MVALSLGVIYEVIWHLIRPYPFLRRFAFKFFWIVAAVALVLGLIMFLSHRFSRILSSRSSFWADRSVRFPPTGTGANRSLLPHLQRLSGGRGAFWSGSSPAHSRQNVT